MEADKIFRGVVTLNAHKRVKMCPCCGRTLPIDEFPFNHFERSNGHIYRDCYCRECRRMKANEYYRRNRDRVLAKLRMKRQNGKDNGKQNEK